jgi:multisubunit Na+/H+ antiporter MnhC subunit
MSLFERSSLPGLPPGIDLCLIPAGVSPDGRPPNFTGGPSLQPAVIVITTIMVGLAFFVLAGRLFVNRNQLKLPDCKPASQVPSLNL